MAETQNKQLQKTVIIETETYDINAVYSDEAGKTTESLTLYHNRQNKNSG